METNFSTNQKAYKSQTIKFLYRILPWARFYRYFLCLKLCYNHFKRFDWLKVLVQPIRKFKTSHRTLTIGGSITVWLVYSLTRLDLTNNVFCMKWSSWIQACKTEGRPISDTSHNSECSLNKLSELVYRAIILGGALLSVIVSAYHLATRVRIPSTQSMLNIVQIINLSLNWNAKRMKINKKRPRFPHFFQKSIATLPAPVREIFVVEVSICQNRLFIE